MPSRCISFLGYDEVFWIVYLGGKEGLDNPLVDRLARSYFESHNAAPIAYINGHSILDSYQISQNTFNNWIQEWEQKDSQVAAYIMHDRDHQVLIPEVPIEPKRPIPKKPIPIAPLVIFAGIEVLAIAILLTLIKRRRRKT